jgi:hypothetical protein
VPSEIRSLVELMRQERHGGVARVVGRRGHDKWLEIGPGGGTLCVRTPGD